MEFNVELLAKVVEIMKTFFNHKQGTYIAGVVSLEKLTATYFKIGVSERNIVNPFSSLQSLINAFEEALAFKVKYCRMVELKKKVIVCHLNKLKCRNGQDCGHRGLNAVRLIALYNQISESCKLKLPYTVVIRDLVNKVRSGLTIHCK